MKEIKVSVNSWYVVEGTAGATVINPSTNKAIATVEDGKQASFYATTPYVLASDDSVSVYKTTFNSAPAKLRLLGLLGGGVSTSSALPAGYLAAEFVESTGEQYVTIPFVSNAATSAVMVETEHYSVTLTSSFHAEGDQRKLEMGVYSTTMYYVQSGGSGAAVGSLSRNTWNVHKALFENKKITIFLPDGKTDVRTDVNSAYSYSYNLFKATFSWPGRKRTWKAWIDGVLQFDLIPAIDPQSVPCMYDKLTKTAFPNSGSGQLIVGINLKQACKLADLPAGGGTLTVSLPTGYESDAGVMSALETARGNGWTITVQTYDAEAAASTFGMRRIWVRKQQDAQGYYVDADGTRWQVDWCVAMYTPDNSEPDAHGYELYRSVDAAVAYWELEPWVDPEAENLLTEYNANE